MGKNARLRREREDQLEKREKQAIIVRRQIKFAPLRRLIIKGIVTVVLTVTVLYVGWLVNDHLPSIVNEMRGGR